MPRSRAIVVSALVGVAAAAVMTAGAAFAQGDGGFGGGASVGIIATEAYSCSSR